MSRERDERMWKQAYKLADSGKYLGWLQIEWELREQGYSRARQLLDHESTRADLDRRCNQARDRRHNA